MDHVARVSSSNGRYLAALTVISRVNTSEHRFAERESSPELRRTETTTVNWHATSTGNRSSTDQSCSANGNTCAANKIEAPQKNQIFIKFQCITSDGSYDTVHVRIFIRTFHWRTALFWVIMQQGVCQLAVTQPFSWLLTSRCADFYVVNDGPQNVCVPWIFTELQSIPRPKKKIWTQWFKWNPAYQGADKSLARPTSRCILFDCENISFDASLVYIYSTDIPPIMIINRI